MKSLATSLGVGLCGLTLLIWAVRPLAQQPQFKAGTELVTIDVVATDIHGKPVKSLAAADFEIFEDGVPQQIQAFQFIDTTTVPPRTLLRSGVVDNQDEPGALFAVVLDELGIGVNDVRDLRRVASRFFEASLQPNDYIAVVRSGARSGFFLTSNRSLALDAIAQSTGRLDRGLRLEQAGEAMTGTDRGDLANLTPAGSGKASFDVLFEVVEKFRPITARRKAIIWFSRGGDISFETFDALAENRPDARADDRLTRLIKAARAANVAIYTLDPRGLSAPSTEGSQAPASEAVGALGTLRDLAAATGGRALVNANDLDVALDRVAEENRAYYLLGYATASDPKSRRARKLQVRTRVPGVALLHRSIVTPLTPNETRPNLELAASPLPVRDLPIMLAPAVVAGAGGRRGIIVPFEIGASLPDGTEVQYEVFALNAAGQQKAQRAGRATVAGGRVHGVAQLVVPDGIYQVRVAATSKSANTRGLAMATVIVPQGRSEKATCSGFVFEPQGGAAGFRRFSSDRPLKITTLVSAAQLGTAPLEFGLGAAGGVPEKRWPAPLGEPVEKGLWQLSLQLNAPLPKGLADIALLQGGTPLGEGCRTTFQME